MQTTRDFLYLLERQEDGRLLVRELPATFSDISVTDTPYFANGMEGVSTEPDPEDDLAVLGDRPSDLVSFSGALAGAPLPYVGLLEGDASALVFGFENGGMILLSDAEYTLDPEAEYKLGQPVTLLSAVPGEGGANQFVLDEQEVTCFAEGTRVLTVRGEVAVEGLVVGDRVVTLSGVGPVLKPIVWIGRRVVDVARHAEPHRVRPIRIRAGALAEGVPHRDLVVSPEHALLLDGALVHAKTLVNGATVVQEERASVTYLHLDLGCHDVVVAEGAAAESYLNDDGRVSFDNAASASVVALRQGDGARVPAYEPCAPVLRSGPGLLAILAGLMERAEALGWERSREAGLRLMADGRAVRGEAGPGGVHRFAVPAGTVALRLLSRAGRPLGTTPGKTDGRWLGVQLGGLAFEPARGEAVAVALDHAGLAEGFSHPERRDGVLRRWTTGDADLAPALPGLAGGGVLTLQVSGTPAFWVERSRDEERRAALA